MKRKTAIKTILSCFKDNDIAIFLGAGLCKEAYSYDRDGNFYIDDSDCNGLSIALGIALNTDKRVFVFCNDSDILKNISSMINLAISKCKNLCILILRSGKYQESGGQITIFNSILAPKGVLFNMGFVIYDGTQYLKTKSYLKEFEQLIERIVGPVVILVGISSGIDDMLNKQVDKVLMVKKIKNFIIDKELGTSLYTG